MLIFVELLTIDNFLFTLISIILKQYWLSYVCPVCLDLLTKTTFKLFGIPICWLWAHWKKIIPETRRVCYYIFNLLIMSRKKIIPETRRACYYIFNLLIRSALEEDYSRNAPCTLLRFIRDNIDIFFFWIDDIFLITECVFVNALSCAFCGFVCLQWL
jgi:hypothetical protein